MGGVNWWCVGGVLCAAAAVVGGTALVRQSRKSSDLTEARGPGAQAFYNLITQGIRDGDLVYRRDGLLGMTPFRKTFGDAQALGIQPTDLATSGRYFGAEVLPIRIQVSADGRVILHEGRRRYVAAKESGAQAILADVVELDGQGDVVSSQQTVVRLL